MTEMNVAQMDAIEGGIDWGCLSWAAVGVAVGSLGGPVGAVGGGIVGYQACTTYKAITE